MRIVLACLWAWSLGIAPALAQDFYLKDGDRVVFYGDSITEQREYTARVEEFVLSRFPSWNVSFVHAGVGGDTVRGGWAGEIDERLSRDVIAFKPTVVTIMLGMNDGGYKAFDVPTFETYRSGYRHILDRLTKEVPGVRLTLIQPSPYDDVTRPETFAGGYNAVMRKYAELVQSLAGEYHATVVDFNSAVVRGLERVFVANAQLARQILPDRVHPAPPGHWLMAEALLRAWHAPALVSAVQLDASGRVVKADRATVTALAAVPSGLTWTQQDASLPLPQSFTDATMELVRAAGGTIDALDEEILKVQGLAAGRYRIRVDDDLLTPVFSEADLANGVNLAMHDTPMVWQAMGVRWSGQEKNAVHESWMRAQVRAKTLPATGSLTRDLEALETALDKERVATRQPKPHRMAIVPDAAH